jgi:oxygen-independent coproporphyrinogen-3 oxidase
MVSRDRPFGEPRALYVHVPFCRHRCGYCDFTLVAGRDDLIEKYLTALQMELQFAVPEGAGIDTLFFGGGTPTHLGPSQLARLVTMARDRVRLSPGAEISVEANPLDLTEERLAVLRESGVNRVSLGVQSFDSRELVLLERDHSGNEARGAVARTKSVIPNVGIDLIFGLPGQTVEQWQSTLDQGVALDPSHISTYGLTFEKGTAFWTRREHGQLVSAPEETERQMYELAMDRLPRAGYPQYELSNFAKSEFECRHNQVYWDAGSYFAAGPGAASYVDGVRRTNHRSTTTWIHKTLANCGEAPTSIVEQLSAEDRAREAIMLGLRRTTGIDDAGFKERFGYSITALGGRSLERFLDRGWLERVDGALRLTREGRCVADTVIAEFLVG